MANLPLLYWAAAHADDGSFRLAGEAHARMTGRAFIRDDASTYHAVEYDLETGDRSRGFTFQGAFEKRPSFRRELAIDERLVDLRSISQSTADAHSLSRLSRAKPKEAARCVKLVGIQGEGYIVRVPDSIS